MAEELLPWHPHAAGDLYYPTAGDFPPIPHDIDLILDDTPFPDQFDFDLGLDLDADINLDDLCFVEDLLVDPDSSPVISDDDAAALTVPIFPSCPLSIIYPSNSRSASPHLEQNVGDRAADVEARDAVRVLTHSSPATSRESRDRGLAAGVDSVYPPCESATLSSHGSDGCDSGVCQGVHSPSRSGNSERHVSSSFNFVKQIPEHGSIEGRKGKVGDGTVNKSLSKRKKEVHGEENVESRTSKFRKSSMASENTGNFSAGLEEDEKRKGRLTRNRESAQLSRQRKKLYVEELEDKVRAMRATIADLNGKISFIMAENASLRQQLSGSGVCPPPPPGMYPVAPMAYQWMPFPPYGVQRQGSLVPLVPIPRQKPQLPAQAPAPKVNKKSEGKKSEGKTKKVASISFLGLLFFILLFGGLVPMVNVKYGGTRDAGFLSGRFDDTQRGKVLRLNSHLNGTDRGGSVGVFGGRVDRGNGHCLRVNCRRLASDMERKEHDMHVKPGSGGFSSVDNSSEPLVASLYVPRNDKIVKIDGNLIIHSIMATEKVRSSATERKKIGEETSLALLRNYGQPYPIPRVGRNNPRHSHMERDSSGCHRVLGSDSTEDLRTSLSDGKLQQWFREGLAGPMLSSGMCTEVFQYEVSPTPGAIVPASPVANNTSPDNTRRNYTRLNKHSNRRIFHGTVPANSHALNVTEEKTGPNSQKDGLPGNKSRSSIIVNVLVDPREAGDGDGDGIMGGKALSRIFVVVLIDSVKYVTYSCMLPRVGSGPQLVTS